MGAFELVAVSAVLIQTPLGAPWTAMGVGKSYLLAIHQLPFYERRRTSALCAMRSSPLGASGVQHLRLVCRSHLMHIKLLTFGLGVIASICAFYQFEYNIVTWEYAGM